MLPTNLLLLLSGPTSVEEKVLEKILWARELNRIEKEEKCRRNFWTSMGVPENEILDFLMFQFFPQISIDLYVFDGWRNTSGKSFGSFLGCPGYSEAAFLVKELRMSLITRNDMVQISFSQSFVTILQVGAGDNVRLIAPSWVSFTNWCFLICSNIALFQWLSALVSSCGDFLWHKLEAIQAGYESLGFIGKRHIIQRLEETFEYRETFRRKLDDI